MFREKRGSIPSRIGTKGCYKQPWSPCISFSVRWTWPIIIGDWCWCIRHLPVWATWSQRDFLIRFRRLCVKRLIWTGQVKRPFSINFYIELLHDHKQRGNRYGHQYTARAELRKVCVDRWRMLHYLMRKQFRLPRNIMRNMETRFPCPCLDCPARNSADGWCLQ